MAFCNTMRVSIQCRASENEQSAWTGQSWLTQPAFDSDRNADCILHGCAACSYQLGLLHQRCTKAACAGHSVARTATVQVDLIIPVAKARLSCSCEQWTAYVRHIDSNVIEDTCRSPALQLSCVSCT